MAAMRRCTCYWLLSVRLASCIFLVSMLIALLNFIILTSSVKQAAPSSQLSEQIRIKYEDAPFHAWLGVSTQHINRTHNSSVHQGDHQQPDAFTAAVQSAVNTSQIAQQDKSQPEFGAEMHSWSFLTSAGQQLLKRNLSSLRIYVYPLAAEFNTDLAQCAAQNKRNALCMDFDNHGCGKESGDEQDRYVRIHSTHQFALEVLFHEWLIRSAYMTSDPEKADMFYVPFYVALACFCRYDGSLTSTLIKKMWNIILREYPYLQKGKPHFMALGKIEQEMANEQCSILRGPDVHRMKYLLIEQTYWQKARRFFQRLYHEREVVVAPYPSSVHFTAGLTANLLNSWLDVQERVTLVLMIGSLKTSPLRKELAMQLSVPGGKYKFIKTPTTECSMTRTARNLIDEMRRATFCLQPPGDTPTRKGFYDALLAGCIPVIFLNDVVYPFEDFIDYRRIRVYVKETDLLAQKLHIGEVLSRVPASQVQQMQQDIAKMAPLLQYGYHYDGEDAFTMLLRTLTDKFNLVLT